MNGLKIEDRRITLNAGQKEQREAFKQMQKINGKLSQKNKIAQTLSGAYGGK